ncbi:glycosyltransferase [Kineococcus rhizosphaerae]|uniref:Glycosyltransferase involved in cell wall biosynthesis n=1 Tax=Kineococcus rhizosphaerae TaxID=559628 RepID=A0A2T0QYY9_9ACTN|nr:glycosyltransferase [Kineococcus rhizosphaerae]PRY11724.1 glycosyltransferase involved in cell wall biosynthesis [Kineococcus rhizosphaerae]
MRVPEAAVVCLVLGPATHGVTAEALAQWDVLRTDGRGPVHLVRREGPPDLTDLTAALRDVPAGVVSLHVTDRLLGPSPEDAAALVEGLARQRPLVLTLHDLPQASDGAVNHPRRAAAYGRMARVAAHVVVASRHEERLLAACGVERPCTVVPLPVPHVAPSPAAAPGTTPTAVAVLGYLYPGKGHLQVVEALDALPAGVGLLALGRPSDGHEDLVDELVIRAAAAGRSCRITGFVPSAELPARLRSAVLPVAPHEHLSASGSISTWIGAGRRPLVPRSDYAEELLERSPGCVTVYDDLRTALARAWADPASTWAGAAAGPPGPTVAQTTARLRAVLRAAGRHVLIDVRDGARVPTP